MAYELKREEGTVIGEKQIKVPRSEVSVTVEIRKHSLDAGNVSVAWYNTDGKWKILLAGLSAERLAAK